MRFELEALSHLKPTSSRECAKQKMRSERCAEISRTQSLEFGRHNYFRLFCCAYFWRPSSSLPPRPNVLPSLIVRCQSDNISRKLLLCLSYRKKHFSRSVLFFYFLSYTMVLRKYSDGAKG